MARDDGKEAEHVDNSNWIKVPDGKWLFHLCSGDSSEQS